MSDRLLEKARNSVFEKIGRNICNLQKVEMLMKYLVISSTGVHGTASELKPKLQKLEESLAKKSMGLVAKDMFQSVFAEPGNIEPPDNPKETWMSFRISIESVEETIDSLKQVLLDVIKERNDLVHHNVAKYDLKSLKSCRQFAEILEAQNERAKSVFLELKGLVDRVVNVKKSAAEYIASEKFWVQFQSADTRENDANDGAG